jgi:hypothetical protein
MRGNRAEVSLEVEHEYSLDEWDHVRTAAFTRLREDGFIPNELLDLVEHFKGRTVVQPSFGKTADGAGLTLGIKVPDKKTKKTRRNELTASEALAFFLRICLRDLKYAVRRGSAAPVRTEKLVPRSVIAWVATDLLPVSCTGPQLTIKLGQLAMSMSRSKRLSLLRKTRRCTHAN